jgi:hypothetical protein
MSQSSVSLGLSSSTNPWARSAPVTASVEVSPEGVTAEIHDTRPECITGFAALEPSAQHLLVHDAWIVGLRAILNARAEAQEAQLSNIAQTFQGDLAKQLERQNKEAMELIQDALSEYFDPESGCVGERLKHFIGDGGLLAQELRRHLSAENSTLAATLAKNVGEQSLLFKKLSPTESEGVVQTLAQQLRRVLQEEHGEFQKALDPVEEDGAVGKFLRRMREELKEAESDEARQIKLALKHLDANDEQSLLSQLRRDIVAARGELLRAINPAQEDSPLAVIQRTLTTLLASHMKTQDEREEAARKRDEAFHADVRERLERIETRKRVEQRAAAGGRSFEEQVVAFIQHRLSPTGYLIEPTGDFPGLTRKKVGDATIDFPVDHPLHGCRIVVEAKHEEKWTQAKARAELDEARKNRDAQIGLFVLARSHAGDDFPTFTRCGHDVILVWDEEDPSQAAYLEGALMVAMAIATRKQSSASEGDLKALQDVEKRVTDEITRLERVRRHAESIRTTAGKIADEVERGQKELRRVVEGAVATLAALNVELAEDREGNDSVVVET